MKNCKRFTILWLAVAFISAGCAFYSMAGSIPSHINSIAIPLLDNQTSEFGIAENITDDLTDKFLEENILKIEDESEATSILRGTIVKVEDAPYTFSEDEAVKEFRLKIYLDIEWYDVQNEIVLLKKQFSGWGAYGLTGDISNDGVDNDGDGLIDTEDNDEFGEPRSFATNIAVTKIAEDILNEILTSW
ncbi:MAG: LPS assembly lipoprotein LptE [Candidatus Neomarinimicrobiota bacterium]